MIISETSSSKTYAEMFPKFLTCVMLHLLCGTENKNIKNKNKNKKAYILLIKTLPFSRNVKLKNNFCTNSYSNKNLFPDKSMDYYSLKPGRFFPKKLFRHKFFQISLNFARPPLKMRAEGV